MMLFFLNCCSSRSGRNLNPVLVRRGRRTPSGEKKKIYGWNVSALFHISLIRQNKKAITLGQKNTGHGLLTFYHGRHILTGALKVVTHSSAWGRLIELPAATKWGLHPLRVEMNCNLFRPCCSQETKWVWAGEGGQGRVVEGEADRERGLEPQRISNKFTEGERKKKKRAKERKAMKTKPARGVEFIVLSLRSEIILQLHHSLIKTKTRSRFRAITVPAQSRICWRLVLIQRVMWSLNTKNPAPSLLFVCWCIVIPSRAEFKEFQTSSQLVVFHHCLTHGGIKPYCSSA